MRTRSSTAMSASARKMSERSASRLGSISSGRSYRTSQRRSGRGVIGSSNKARYVVENDMRLSNHQVSRDLRSVQLALRMLSHEARTHTVSLWTRISSDRVRKLSISQRREKPQRAARRYRGPSQTQLGTVLTSPSLRSEAAAIAYVCQMFEVMPAQPVENARATLPSVPRGEQVCSALEFFEALVPPTQLTFDQWVLLLQSLAEAKEWGMARCARCPA